MLLKQQSVLKQKDHKLPLCPYHSSLVTHSSEACHRIITCLIKFSLLEKHLLVLPECFSKADAAYLQITNQNNYLMISVYMLKHSNLSGFLWADFFTEQLKVGGERLFIWLQYSINKCQTSPVASSIMNYMHDTFYIHMS